jgi:hypothetical protein
MPIANIVVAANPLSAVSLHPPLLNVVAVNLISLLDVIGSLNDWYRFTRLSVVVADLTIVLTVNALTSKVSVANSLKLLTNLVEPASTFLKNDADVAYKVLFNLTFVVTLLVLTPDTDDKSPPNVGISPEPSGDVTK